MVGDNLEKAFSIVAYGVAAELLPQGAPISLLHVRQEWKAQLLKLVSRLVALFFPVELHCFLLFLLLVFAF